MDTHKLSIKLFAQDSSSLPEDVFVPIFHHWIQTHAIPDHLLIDVTDYSHVIDGPGTVLIASEANFYTDHESNRLGLLYTRKSPLPAPPQDRIRAALKTTLHAAHLLESAPTLQDRLKFLTNELTFRINDRLVAPNTPETFTALKPLLQSVFTDLYGTPITLEHHPDPRRLFEVTIRTHPAPLLPTLLQNL